MHSYGVRDVEKLLGLSRSTVRALIDAGFVTPSRGPRREFRFTFQDLIVLRTAQALSDAQLPRRRIVQSLRELRRYLPQSMPLSGLRIGALADRVVVSEGGRQWQAESGQYLLGFEGDPETGALAVLARPQVAGDARAESGASRETRLGQAVSLELDDVSAAVAAYRAAIGADPQHLDAHINLGRLLHEHGRLAEAERVYRDALTLADDDGTLRFNLGVLLEDLRRPREAVEAYRAALLLDPGMADSHYNLALLHEQLGQPREALRHMSRYRRLAGKPR